MADDVVGVSFGSDTADDSESHVTVGVDDEASDTHPVRVELVDAEVEQSLGEIIGSPLLNSKGMCSYVDVHYDPCDVIASAESTLERGKRSLTVDPVVITSGEIGRKGTARSVVISDIESDNALFSVGLDHGLDIDGHADITVENIRFELG